MTQKTLEMTPEATEAKEEEVVVAVVAVVQGLHPVQDVAEAGELEALLGAMSVTGSGHPRLL